LEAHWNEQSESMVEAWREMAGLEIIPADMKHMRGVMKLCSKTEFSLPANTTIRSIAEGRLFVGLLDNLMVGFIEFDIHHRSTWTIQRLVIAKPVRNHKIGSSLVSTLVDEAQSIGKRVEVTISSQNDKLVEFFIKNHFTTKEVQRNPDNKLNYVMERLGSWQA
jgi:GNAT superfamily N-acetyltransferase